MFSVLSIVTPVAHRLYTQPHVSTPYSSIYRFFLYLGTRFEAMSRGPLSLFARRPQHSDKPYSKRSVRIVDELYTSLMSAVTSISTPRAVPLSTSRLISQQP
ncbi:hypothetical protein BDV98DRAFT_344781 [Pterulicium gracile]|uniref:Uncharacterized protein n=1 Tax=Pterulicium gracile TaxID=1884261 RepID=A0A5C3Q1X1_9AGAR|nr:hypothetical protein BDV98DRAFT_344781 [Pterula gracilis]